MIHTSLFWVDSLLSDMWLLFDGVLSGGELVLLFRCMFSDDRVSTDFSKKSTVLLLSEGQRWGWGSILWTF